MSIFSRALLILALMMSAYYARSDGIDPGGLGFKDGISNVGTAAAVIPGCSGTGLIFTAACNSQYIGIL